MLIITIGKALFSKERYFNVLLRGTFIALLGAFGYLMWSVRLKTIECFSEQGIKSGTYQKDAIHLDVPTFSTYRDHEYHKGQSILLCGKPENMKLISQIHANALEIENRTKGYDVSIPAPSFKDQIEYFLVIEVEEREEGTIILENKGWQVNSDILALFMNKMLLETRTSFKSFFVPRYSFNYVHIGINSKDINEVLDVLWNINNMYSHSLGLYFYWAIGEQAIFLSSVVPLVVVIGLFLLFTEAVTGGSFEASLFKEKLPLLLVPFASPGVSLCLLHLGYFDAFILYCLLVPMHFFVAIIFGCSKILLFLYWFFSVQGEPLLNNKFSSFRKYGEQPEHVQQKQKVPSLGASL
ncbi:hypothetical protein NEFER03_2187 [Nematocida sp. LUAm3]|nr:hypothetical protein NEFER03_2187 [Nematocida sp. LUAm3]KAI5176295.1 hypothetical protein NEFER02_2087 [Nematocida sp. LUAm2]KAI5179233.1 hypothetical protein NEFER01_2087 [Nematocida sp. LUAm1]